MTQFQAFDSFEDMMEAMQQAEEAALGKMTSEQRDLVDQSEHETVYWHRFIEAHNLHIFGEVYSDAEFVELERKHGADKHELYESLASRKNRRDRGYVFSKAYSTIVPDGEFGDTHASEVMQSSAAQFMMARERDWSLPDSLVMALTYMILREVYDRPDLRLQNFTEMISRVAPACQIPVDVAKFLAEAMVGAEMFTFDEHERVFATDIGQTFWDGLNVGVN